MEKYKTEAGTPDPSYVFIYALLILVTTGLVVVPITICIAELAMLFQTHH